MSKLGNVRFGNDNSGILPSPPPQRRMPLKYFLTEKYAIAIDHPALSGAGEIKKMIGCRECGKLTYEDKVLTLHAGFEWDGATGVPDSDSVFVASLVHDALYMIVERAQYNKNHFKIADIIFRDICIAEGMRKFQAKMYYQGLQVYNKFRSIFGMHKNK